MKVQHNKFAVRITNEVLFRGKLPKIRLRKSISYHLRTCAVAFQITLSAIAQHIQKHAKVLPARPVQIQQHGVQIPDPHGAVKTAWNNHRGGFARDTQRPGIPCVSLAGGYQGPGLGVPGFDGTVRGAADHNGLRAFPGGHCADIIIVSWKK